MTKSERRKRKLAVAKVIAAGRKAFGIKYPSYRKGDLPAPGRRNVR